MLVIFAGMARIEPWQYNDPHAWAIDQKRPPQAVWDRILKYHVTPVVNLFHATGVALVPSMGSCYRPVEYERAQGRSGSSLHTFPAHSKGACDLVLSGQLDVIRHMDLVIESLPYRRLCYYPGHGFVHGDYGDQDGTPAARRSMWIADGPGSTWRRLYWLPENLQ